MSLLRRSTRIRRVALAISLFSCVGVVLLTTKTRLSPAVIPVKTEIRSPLWERGTDVSESSDIQIRMKFQQNAVESYCAKHFQAGSKFILPSGQVERELLYRHLLYDDLREMMFCFVEKIGCTDMKRFMFISAGVLPEKVAQHEWVDLKYLERGIKHSSLLNKNLTDFQKLHKIRTYFKFTTLRHPLERLLSGYRNKVEPPLYGLSEKFPNNIKREILQKIQPHIFNKWLKANGTLNVSVTFTDFVKYFIHTDKEVVNPHLKPSINTCHPCRVRYNFYGNFKNFGADVKMVTDYLGISYTWYRNRSLHSKGHETRFYLSSYFNQLSSSQKNQLASSLQDELEFYYMLYPLERDSHTPLLVEEN